MSSTEAPSISQLLHGIEKKESVDSLAKSYLDAYDSEKIRSEGRQHDNVSNGKNFKDVTHMYYDLATDFYEYGWGDSFHFCPLSKHESREVSMYKHILRLASKLGAKSGDEILDVGCGVGGPGRKLASFSGAKVVGLNYSDYQVDRAKLLTEKAGLSHLCSYVKGDFCNTKYPDEKFSKAFAVEATCHASDKLDVYGEVFRILKPGGLFAVYEWVMTDKFDPSNDEHSKIKFNIMEGNSLPIVDTRTKAMECMKQVGFEIVEEEDLALTSDIPWYYPLMGRWTISNFRMTSFGRKVTHLLLNGLEVCRLAPRGSVKVHEMLCLGADNLVKGGQEGIFTAVYLMVARKPLKPE